MRRIRRCDQHRVDAGIGDQPLRRVKDARIAAGFCDAFGAGDVRIVNRDEFRAADARMYRARVVGAHHAGADKTDANCQGATPW